MGKPKAAAVTELLQKICGGMAHARKFVTSGLKPTQDQPRQEGQVGQHGKRSARLMSNPMWKVPRNEDEVNVRKPPHRIKLVTMMAFPVDRKLRLTAHASDLPCAS